eukprot:173682_1
MNRKLFGKNICEYFDNKKLNAVSAKLRTSIMKFSLNIINWNIVETNEEQQTLEQKDQSINENVKELEPYEIKDTEQKDIKEIKDCNHNQMMYLINNIFNET